MGRYHQWLDVISTGDGASFFDIWVPNDGSVKPMYSDQIVFGFEHDPADGLEFTFESYYNDLHDINEYNQVIDRGNDMKDAFLKGDGYAYGFESMLRKKAGKLQGWVGYSLAWSKRKFPDSYINEGAWYYPKWDRRHDFIVVGSYKLSKKWDMGASWRYNTGQGFSRAMGVYTERYQGEHPNNTENDGRDVRYGKKNNYRFPDDHRFDLTFNYHHKFYGLPAKLTISIYNAYSRRSIWFKNYDTEENPVEEQNIKLLPILPLVSYEVKF